MKNNGRITILIGVFVFLNLLVVIRLFYWQVIKAGELAILASNQRENIQKVSAYRGRIMSSDESPLAANNKNYLLFADLTKIDKNKSSEIAKQLAGYFLSENEATFSGKQKKEILNEKKENLRELLVEEDKYWQPLRHRLSEELKEEIESLEIEGLGFEPQINRFYPEASMSAHLLGFVGSNLAGEKVGYFGLEGFYNLELKGRQGLLVEEKDAVNLPIISGLFRKESKRDGRSLVTYVDRSVQAIAEDELLKGLEKYEAKSGWVVIMDPKTGGIISMASYPNYEPGKFWKYEEKLYKNPVISEAYEPGSTFKILVMAAAINEKIVTPYTKCDICHEPYKIDKYTIRTWNNKYYDNQTMTGILVHSDNIGMVFTGQKLGIEKLLQYLENFGIGQKTNIDLQEEVYPFLKNKSDWNNVDLATASFGQGLMVTGIQMIRAVSAIANEGKLMEPHVVHKIIGDRKVLEIKPKIAQQVISPDTARQITQMMIQAVDEGEAKWAKPKGYKIAGKTGTSQIAVKGHYDTEKTIATFVGFAPADDPKFAILVYLREPQSSPWGSETAAPLFFKIAKRLFLYYNIPPEE